MELFKCWLHKTNSDIYPIINIFLYIYHIFLALYNLIHIIIYLLIVTLKCNYYNDIKSMDELFDDDIDIFFCPLDHEQLDNHI